MSLGFAAAHAKISQAHLALEAASRIVGIVAATMPENANKLLFWKRIVELAQDAADIEKLTSKRGKP